jgi:hypothetical protein
MKLRLLVLLTLGSVMTFGAPLARERARTVDTEQMIFSSGGTIELRDSFGAVEIEGWDQPEIEFTVVKASKRGYTAGEMDRAVQELDRLVISTERLGENHLLITTDFGPRSALNRQLRGRNNLDIRYKIKAPRQCRLLIKHDGGPVNVQNVAGHMDITARVGDIAVTVPEDERIVVDAKSRSGEVTSDWGEILHSEMHSPKRLDDPDLNAYRLYLRVGIGDISVKKIKRPRQLTEEIVD